VDQLIVVSGPDKGRIFALPPEGEAVIGRDGVTVPLADSHVSRDHARLTVCDEGWFIEDCGSTNGTIVNGQLLAEPMLLRHGDRIRIGLVVLIYRSHDQPASSALIVHRDDYEEATTDVERAYALADLRNELIAQYRHELTRQVVAEAQPLLLRKKRQFLAACAAMLLLFIGTHVYFLMQSREQTQELTRLAATIAAAPVIDQDQLMRQIHAAVAQQHDPQVRHMLAQLQEEVSRRPQSDPQVHAMLGQVLSVLETQPDHGVDTQRVLDEVLAAMQAAPQQVEEKLDHILTAIQTAPAPADHGELLAEIRDAVRSDHHQEQMALLEEVLASVARHEAILQAQAGQSRDEPPPVTPQPLEQVTEMQDVLAQILVTLESMRGSASAQASTQAKPMLAVLPPQQVMDVVQHADEPAHVPAPARYEAKVLAAAVEERPVSGTVFLVDVSGALAGQMDVVLRELARQMQSADSPLPFSLLLARGDHVLEVPNLNLRETQSDWQEQLAAWLSDARSVNAQRAGLSQAVARADAYQPRVMWVFSDCIYPTTASAGGAAELMRSLDRINRDRTMRLHTTQFFYHDPSGTLKRLAATHGGTYTFVTQRIGP